MNTTRKSTYPSDVIDEQWEFLLRSLVLMREDAPSREHPLRDLFDAIRYLVRTGVQWRYLPQDFPPWTAVYQRARRWLQAGVFEAIAHDPRIVERVLKERNQNPSAVILDGRTPQSMPESGSRGGYDGAKRKIGSKILVAVDTLGNLLALTVTSGNVQEQDQVGELAQKIKELTDRRVKLAYVDQGYIGKLAAKVADEHKIELEVVKYNEVKEGDVLLPRRWVVKGVFVWLGRHRRLARDYERLAKTLAALSLGGLPGNHDPTNLQLKSITRSSGPSILACRRPILVRGLGDLEFCG